MLYLVIAINLAIWSAHACPTTTRTRNLLGVTDFNTRTFSYMGRQPTSLVYGDLENDSVMTTAAVFYLVVTECQSPQAQANKARAGIS